MRASRLCDQQTAFRAGAQPDHGSRFLNAHSQAIDFMGPEKLPTRGQMKKPRRDISAG
jgi:hypothetical protein